MAKKTMTASAEDRGITDGQIAAAKKQLDDAMRKHHDRVQTDVMQRVLGVDNFGMRLFAVIHELARYISRWRIVHLVTVDRTRTPQQALKTSGLKLCINDSIVGTMPCGTDEKVRLVYFKPDRSLYKGGWLPCAELAEEYKKRGLVPDPQAQIDDNVANPEFAKRTPNACQWVDADGEYCYATFGDWNGARSVAVYRRGGLVWDGYWAFAGVPQESLASAV